jgi:hypothetical protein
MTKTASNTKHIGDLVIRTKDDAKKYVAPDTETASRSPAVVADLSEDVRSELQSNAIIIRGQEQRIAELESEITAWEAELLECSSSEAEREAQRIALDVYHRHGAMLGSEWSVLSGLIRLASLAGQAVAVEAEPGMVLVPSEPTPAMIAAYLTANDAYWFKTDAAHQAPDKWHNGTPIEATRLSLQAAFAAATPPQPAALQPPQVARAEAVSGRDGLPLWKLIYGAIMQERRPCTLPEWESAAQRIADMIERRAAPPSATAQSAPQVAREPLTQLECEMLPVWQDAAPWSGAGRLRIVRAIEAAHGITTPPAAKEAP